MTTNIKDKKPVKSETSKESKSGKKLEKEKYLEAVGRRKTAVARVRIFSKKGEEIEIIVNDKKLEEYFNFEEFQKIVKSPFAELSLKNYKVVAKVKGGGVRAQAEAIRLGISRALVSLNPLWRPPLKTLGFLKRDPRMVERKKYGKRKARRPQQWRKR